MSNDHFQFTDAEFERLFEEMRLDPTLFTHEAHLRLAYIHIKKYGVNQAIDNICRQIAQFDRSFGDGTKFNVTITHAAVYAVHHFMQKSSSENFSAFIQRFPQLKSNFKDLILLHYSWDIFQDKSAKSQYLEPDLVPFML